MTKELQKRLDLFERNNQKLLKKYWYTFSSLPIIASTVCANHDAEVDMDKWKECKTIMKKHFGAFSNVRGMMELPLIAEMAVSPDPEAYITRLGEIYDTLKKGKLFRSEFDVLCANILQKYKGNINLEEAMKKIHQVYTGMKAKHPFLTGEDDQAVATLFALSGKDPDALLDEMEACYQILKSQFKLSSSDKVQTLSAMLALQEGTAQQKCDRVVELCKLLKEQKLSVNLSYALPMVAVLASLQQPPKQTVADIAEIEAWLKGKKGFGIFGQGKEGRIAFAMLMYINSCLEETSSDSLLVNSTMTSIIMYEIILMVMITSIAASTAVTVSSSSSKN